MKVLTTLFLFLGLLNCTPSEGKVLPAVTETNSPVLNEDLSYEEVLQRIGADKLFRAVEKPNPDGSLGRNRTGYFHVRFQINMSSLSDYALVAESQEALDYFLTTMDYSFAHQLDDGSFAVVVPEELRNVPDYHPPSPADLASGTAFFASSLGKSLLSLKGSAWYAESMILQDQRDRLDQHRLAIENALQYLLDSKNLLLRADAQAPNRLLFDALAFYSLGKYCSRQDAVDLAFLFVEEALAQTDEQVGYFIEGGGWDSSYNGVAINLAIELFLLAEEPELKQKLKRHFVPSTNWQISRILNNGSISTEGNTRVFAGGESFLGEEKGVDYVKTIKALYYFGILTDQPDIITLGDRVLGYYN
jgi:hypothetical protein